MLLKRQLPEFLLSLHQKYDRQSLADDPIHFVHQYTDPRDQEIVAFFSALLAFGNVKAIHHSLRRLFEILGPHPFSFISTFDPARQSHHFKTLRHRWVGGEDLLLLVIVLRDLLEKLPSLKSFFLENFREDDPDTSSLLDRISQNLLKRAGPEKVSRGFRYFLPSPSGGSPCKRLHLFLRWMVRPKDGIDLGLWPEIPTSKLIIPLDTHLYRFARRFRISRYRTANGKMAREITKYLRQLDPIDPVKFDFPICHYGMEIGW